MKRIIDTDTASDDAVALMMAMASPVEIAAITTVAGNVPLGQATLNALYVRELCADETPVYAGAASPLGRPLQTAQFVHGEDGMGDIGLPLSGRAPEPGDAIDVIIETIRRHPGAIDLVTLGPLTNIATSLIREPAIAASVRRCIIMGGASDGVGNVSPVAEFNIWADPDAAEIVFRSGLPVWMVGWDVSRKYAVITPEEETRLRQIPTDKARVAMDCQVTVKQFAREHTRLAGFDLPDPIAMAVALDESIATRVETASVRVNTGFDLWRGHTLMDWRGLTGPRDSHIVLEASHDRFVDMLRQSLEA